MRVCSTLPVSRDWWWPSNQETKIPTTNGKGRDIRYQFSSVNFWGKIKNPTSSFQHYFENSNKNKNGKGLQTWDWTWSFYWTGFSSKLSYLASCWWLCQGACYQDSFYYDLVQRVEQRCLGHLSSHTEIHAAFSLRLWIWYTHKNLNERERKKCSWIGLCWEKTHFSNLLH